MDDSRDDAERIVGVLRGAGHRLVWKWVDSAGTLAVALSERDWEWHAITCGCGMAKLHHLSALHITQALAPRTPVILLGDFNEWRPPSHRTSDAELSFYR